MVRVKIFRAILFLIFYVIFTDFKTSAQQDSSSTLYLSFYVEDENEVISGQSLFMSMNNDQNQIYSVSDSSGIFVLNNIEARMYYQIIYGLWQGSRVYY